MDKRIELTRGHFAIVDDDDFELVNRFKWYSSDQGSAKKPYAVRQMWIKETKKKKKIWMHRLIMNCPDEFVIDHLNGDGLDNRKCNLEIVTFAENYCRSQQKRKLNIEDISL